MGVYEVVGLLVMVVTTGGTVEVITSVVVTVVVGVTVSVWTEVIETTTGGGVDGTTVVWVCTFVTVVVDLYAPRTRSARGQLCAGRGSLRYYGGRPAVRQGQRECPGQSKRATHVTVAVTDGRDVLVPTMVFGTTWLNDLRSTCQVFRTVMVASVQTYEQKELTP